MEEKQSIDEKTRKQKRGEKDRIERVRIVEE